jgi:hypothetical protein
LKKRLFPSCFGPTLQQLKIFQTNEFDDACLQSITEVCKSIHTLEIECCRSLTAKSIQTLAKLPNLVHLKINGLNEIVSNDFLRAIARRGKLEV